MDRERAMIEFLFGQFHELEKIAKARNMTVKNLVNEMIKENQKHLKVPVTVRLPADMVEKLKKLARVEGPNFDSVVETAIDIAFKSGLRHGL